jgi:hypothetical protein
VVFMTNRWWLVALLVWAAPSVARAQAPDPIFRDGFQCPYPQYAEIGGPCTSDAHCDSLPGAGDGICLAGTVPGLEQWPAAGYCSRACSSHAICGPDAACAALGACLPVCCVGGSCAPGFVCADQLLGVDLAVDACLPGDPAAVDGSPCQDLGDCNAAQCMLDLEHPGGECSRLGCTVGMDATCSPGGDGHCAVLPGALVPSCIDACAGDADCRQSEGYRCVDGGVGTGRYCRAPHVGDACATDADCGDVATWDCRIGLVFPGGYCTMGCPTPGSSQGCVAGSSVCASGFPGPHFCADRCPDNAIGTQAHCRPGYTCRDADPSPSQTVGACVSP